MTADDVGFFVAAVKITVMIFDAANVDEQNNGLLSRLLAQANISM